MNKEDIPPITSDIYIILSCYNEEETLEEVVTGLVERGFKVIIVDDGSKDNSPVIARQLVKKFNPNVYHYRHIINVGLGGAIKTGIRAALSKGADIMITFDADGQHEISDIPGVCKPLQEGKADVVIGSRPFEDMPISKSFANIVMNALTRIFYGRKVKDSQSGLRAFTADAADKINIVSAGYGVSSEFIKEISDKKLRLDEVTITTIYTPETQHKGTDAIVGLKILAKMVIDLFRI